MENQEKIILNGKEISKEKFEEEKEKIKNTKGMQLVEIGNNQYKTRLLD